MIDNDELDDGAGVPMPAPPCTWCNTPEFTAVVYGRRLCLECGTTLLRALRETRAAEAARMVVAQEHNAEVADW